MTEMTALERSIHDVLARLGTPGVIAAYLFGSHARESAHRESDVDVGVVLDYGVHATRASRFEERIRLASELIGELHVNAVDLVVLNDAPPLLARRVLLEGRQVYCADADADRDFRRDTLFRAADLEPFLARMRALKLAALGR
jgi:predicted nucleotidyltransferase